MPDRPLRWWTAALLSAAVLGACTDGGDGGSATAAPAASLPCIGVGPWFADELQVPLGMGLAATRPGSPPGWFVSAAAGAAWWTDRDPAAAEAGGRIVPLNDEAIAASPRSVAGGVGAGAPEGATASHTAVVRARDCARARGGGRPPRTP